MAAICLAYSWNVISHWQVNFVLQVVKENQILHKGSKVIDGETDCLADRNIFPGDVLWVTDSKIHENRDIAGRTLLHSKS